MTIDLSNGMSEYASHDTSGASESVGPRGSGGRRSAVFFTVLERSRAVISVSRNLLSLLDKTAQFLAQWGWMPPRLAW